MLLAMLGWPIVAAAQLPALLELTAAELERLGIEWARAEPAASGRVVLSAPAATVVPPEQERIVSAPVGGLVTRLYVAEGSEVEAGDPLVELRSLDLLDAQREYVDAVSAARLADAQLERDRMLHDEGIVARRRVDEAEAAALAARVRAERAREQLRIVGADQAALERVARGVVGAELTLRAPDSGVIVARHGAVGEQVDALEPIVRLADLRRLWLEARIPQERADEIAAGMRLEVIARGETIGGQIFQVGRVVDAATQTVLVRAVVENRNLALRAGQLLPARILAGGGAGELAVPMSAVTRIEGQAFVFRRMASGIQPVPVTVVGEDGRQAQIEAPDLQVGTEIAGRGVSALKALLTADDAE